MGYSKFNGILKEIIEQNPDADIAGFLQEQLRIPLDKAEELAVRIEKKYCLKSTARKEPTEVTEETESSPKARFYSLECLSGEEFERFMKWLFGELGYEIQFVFADNLAVGFVALKDGEKFAVQTIKVPLNLKAQNLVVLKSNEAKLTNGCSRSIVVVTSCFSQTAALDAQNLAVELWDRETLAEKIDEVKQKADLEEQIGFPQYKGTLLQSLLRLEETKDFIIEPRADGKYDLHLPGIKYPLLTFQARGDEVVRCVFRIKYNEPVGEFDGEILIGCDHNGCRFGPDGAEAYEQVIQYLEQFVE
jgi:hypothetical protein